MYVKNSTILTLLTKLTLLKWPRDIVPGTKIRTCPRRQTIGTIVREELVPAGRKADGGVRRRAGLEGGLGGPTNGSIRGPQSRWEGKFAEDTYLWQALGFPYNKTAVYRSDEECIA